MNSSGQLLQAMCPRAAAACHSPCVQPATVIIETVVPAMRPTSRAAQLMVPATALRPQSATSTR
jgi:hypothetical protein